MSRLGYPQALSLARALRREAAALWRTAPTEARALERHAAQLSYATNTRSN